MLGVRIPHVQRRFGKLSSFPIAQGACLHLLDHSGNVAEPARDLECTIDDVVNHIASVRHMQEPKVTDLRAQPVGAEGPE